MTATGEGGLVTTATSLISRSGHEASIARDFEEAFSGPDTVRPHLATLLIQQENGLNFLVSQFRSAEDLAHWHASADHARMIAAFEEHSLRELCTIDRRVARITVPSNDSGPKWKVLISTWIAIFPLLIMLSWLLDRIVPGLPFVARLALTSFLMSVTIIWLVSPIVRRLTRTWRLSHQQMRIGVAEVD